jgi:hypothetical protein
MAEIALLAMVFSCVKIIILLLIGGYLKNKLNAVLKVSFLYNIKVI